MSTTSFYKLSEQIMSRLGKGEPQEIIEAVRQSYGTAVKMLWYEGKKADLSELDGAFYYSFGKDPDAPLIPVLDEATDQYFIDIPTTYVSLPHETQFANVSYLKSQNKPFVRLPNGALGIYSGLQSYHAGGHGMFTVEDNRMYFPKMKEVEVGPILLVIAVGVDQVDIDEEINIPLNVQDMIVEMVVEKYAPKPTGPFPVQPLSN